jgi:AcrR family transcriptional regulator
MKDNKRRIKRTKADVTLAIKLAAIEQIKKGGFSSSVVTGIMKLAKIEPSVFYNRYKNIEEFYDQFVRDYDYWLNDIIKKMPSELTTQEGYKNILQGLLSELQHDSVMLELLRWEVSDGNSTTNRTAMLRELQTMGLTNEYCNLFKDTDLDIVAFSSLLIGGIYYLSLHKERSPFCGIDLNTEEGFDRISKALSHLAKLSFEYKQKQNKMELFIQRLIDHGVNKEIIKDCLK